MSLPDPDRLLDTLRRGRLTADQEEEVQAFLVSHPEQRTLWEEELSLNDLLSQVPDAPLPSNFTAQVLQTVRAETRVRSGWRSVLWQGFFLGRWAPRLAAVSTVFCLGLLSYHQYQHRQLQAAACQEWARNLVEIHQLTQGATLDMLRNFDAIERLNQVPRDADRDLIAALQ